MPLGAAHVPASSSRPSSPQGTAPLGTVAPFDLVAPHAPQAPARPPRTASVAPPAVRPAEGTPPAPSDTEAWLRLRSRADHLYASGERTQARAMHRLLWTHMPMAQVTRVLEAMPPAVDPKQKDIYNYLRTLHCVSAVRNTSPMRGGPLGVRVLSEALQQAAEHFPALPDAFVALADLVSRYPHEQLFSPHLTFLNRALSGPDPMPDAHFARAMLLQTKPESSALVAQDLQAARALRPDEPIFALAHATWLLQTDASQCDEAIGTLLGTLGSKSDPQDELVYWAGLGTTLRSWRHDELLQRTQDYIVDAAFDGAATPVWAFFKAEQLRGRN